MNGVMLQAFQWELPADGALWEVLRRRAWTLRRMGFTAVWMPPAFKGAAGAQDVGYGVYDLYDLGEFRQKGSVATKYGDRRSYLAAVTALSRAGLQPLADVVLNHRMGADRTEEVTVTPVCSSDRRQAAGAPLHTRAHTAFTFPGRQGRHSSFTWDAGCFTGVDRTEAGDGVFLMEGKQWAADVDGEWGNYDFLMGADVDVNAPRVRRELIRWGRWYLDTAGVGGFRLDAVKHLSAAFLREWLQAMRAHRGQELFAVGEYWHPDVNVLAHYLQQTDFSMSLFDVPLHLRFHRIGEIDLRGLFHDTLTARFPHLSVTFVDNHDTQPGQALESWTPPWFKPAAYGMILLRQSGYPCVFWGDLYGIPTRGIEPVWALPSLLRLRARRAWGPERLFAAQPQLLGLTREGDDAHPGSGLVFLCSTGPAASLPLCAGPRLAGRTLRCLAGRGGSVSTDSGGWGLFPVGERGWSVWGV